MSSKTVKKQIAKPCTQRTTGGEQEATALTVELDATIGIAGVKPLWETLVAFLSDKREVVLKASQVESIDTAALQLLAAFIFDAQSRDIEVRWESPSTALRRAAALLDLEHHLQLKPVE